MLTPFHGYVPSTLPAASAAAAASLARSVRDEAGRYQSRETLDRAVVDGRLSRSDTPCLYRYTITGSEGGEVVGIVGACPVAELLPHEETLPGALRMAAHSVEIRPVLVLSDEPLPVMEELASPIVLADAEGRSHTLAPARVLGGIPPGPYVVADGHHRRRAALETWGEGCSVLTLLVGSAGAGLEAGTFHRRFPGVGALPPEVHDRFAVSPAVDPAPVAGALVWIGDPSGRVLVLTPRPDALAAVPPARRGSAAAVAAALLYPLLGVTDQDAEYLDGPEAAAGLPPGDGVLLLPPIAIATVMDAARTGVPLPPKSSRFRPKPLRGIVVREAVS